MEHLGAPGQGGAGRLELQGDNRAYLYLFIIIIITITITRYFSECFIVVVIIQVLLLLLLYISRLVHDEHSHADSTGPKLGLIENSF